MLLRIHYLVLVGVFFMLQASTADGQLKYEESAEGILVQEDETNVLFYQRAEKSLNGTHSRAHYIHPLYSLDGRVLTEDFPSDHLHHRGVFWAWHQLRIGAQVIGDGWALQDLRWDVRQATPEQNDDGSITLNLLVDWKSPQWRIGMEPVVIEQTFVRIYPLHDNHRAIDFEVRLRATQPQTYIGGSEDDKGYGGFSVRIKLPADIEFKGPGGVVVPQKTAVDPSPWISMTGTLGDPPSEAGSTNGLIMFCHPQTPGCPQPWILREQRSMQNAVWPGRDATPLSMQHPVVLRYRLVVHRDRVTPEVMGQWYQEYCQRH